MLLPIRAVSHGGRKRRWNGAYGCVGPAEGEVRVVLGEQHRSLLPRLRAVMQGVNYFMDSQVSIRGRI